MAQRHTACACYFRWLLMRQFEHRHDADDTTPAVISGSHRNSCDVCGDASDPFLQPFDAYRLDQVLSESRLAGLFHVLILAMAANGNRRLLILSSFQDETK